MSRKTPTTEVNPAPQFTPNFAPRLLRIDASGFLSERNLQFHGRTDPVEDCSFNNAWQTARCGYSGFGCLCNVRH